MPNAFSPTANPFQNLTSRGFFLGWDVVWIYATLGAMLAIPSGVWIAPQAVLGSVGIALLVGLYISSLATTGAYAHIPTVRPDRVMSVSGGVLVVGLLAAGFQQAAALGNPLAVPLPELEFARTSAGQSVSPAVFILHSLLSLAGILGARAAHASMFAPPIDEPSNTRLDDFIDRPSVRIHTAQLKDILESQTVLVTGAGGSIGSELSKQLAHLQPDRLVLVDMCEHNLYQIEQDLHRLSLDVPITYSLTDLRNRTDTERLFQRHRPDLVIHAAAYKHVPMMERHPAIAFENNTLATAQLVDLAEEYGSKHFIFVSTDKAVEPESILGATKQFSEWYVQAASSTRMKRKVVRFGNVFGSAGSVVPLFEECLRRGEPLRVTHPNMERFFMSVEEACGLILETLLHDNYPMYLLRMGAPVRIEWLARQMIEARMPDADPDEWIQFTDPRPGEKLKEKLTASCEEPIDIDHPSIVGVQSPVQWSRSDLRKALDRMHAQLCDATATTTDLHQSVFALVHGPSGDGAVPQTDTPTPSSLSASSSSR